jgi:hypothetical protein
MACNPGPYYSVNYTSNTAGTSTSLNGTATNSSASSDLTTVFSAIRIIYTSVSVNIGGDSSVASSGGQGGQFWLVVNTSDGNIQIGAGGYLNGSGSYSFDIGAYCAQLFVCCGQGNGYTSFITIGNTQSSRTTS